MDIKLTDYQTSKIATLANSRAALDNEMKSIIAIILDANGQKTDSQVSFDIDKKVLTLEDKPKK